jgi:hypothetical protein
VQILGVSWADALMALSAAVGAVGVGFLGLQIKQSKDQAQAEFEDSIQRDYREILKELPVEVFLGVELSEAQRSASLGLFYRYFNLSNTQAKLWSSRKIRLETWTDWKKGIHANLARAEFRKAWEEIESKSPKGFGSLRALIRGDVA